MASRWRGGLLAILLGIALLPGFGSPARCAAGEPASKGAPSASDKIDTLMKLLADPEVHAALARRDGGAGTESPAVSPPPPTMAITLADRLQHLRQHLIDLLAASKTLPSQAATAQTMVASALDQRGWWSVAIFFVGFVAFGFGTEWLFRITLRPAQHWLLHLTLASVNERVRAVFARFAFGLGLVVFFALGSVGAFLLFDWPTVIKEILLGYLIAFLTVRLFAVIGRLLLAPGAARFRVVPMSTQAAQFLFVRWLGLTVLVAFGWQTISLFGRFGLLPLSAELCGDAIAIVVLLVGLDIVWRVPRLGLAESGRESRFADRHYPAIGAVTSMLLVLLALLWIVHATQLFGVLAFAVGLPLTIMVARRSVNHVLRPAGSSISIGDSQTLDVVVFERGVRTVIIVGAALLLGRLFGVDLISLTMRDTLTTRLVRGAVGVVVIGLAADFLWHVIKALIDRKLASNMIRPDNGEDSGHAARLQTLLPIVSNILLAVIVVVSAMMALAAAGVEIGPLIASAGVVGVAIGFGAQTLVRDIISGIFYLVDDAFRIGEYIQSGTYKGTVESFSLRSVKLRHQRGALYTVPFGVLGAVQNQSRDWVVDKIVMNVPYGTDLEKVRKLIKRIGESLSEDPDFGPEIINPLKMQGVVQFGDFAIQIQTKMMTKPGDVQFMARRRALLMINRAFADNGIGFAMPMVHVAGDGSNAAAAAQKGFELLRPVVKAE